MLRLLLALTLLCPAASLLAADYAVVVASNSPLQISDARRLQDVFLRKRSFDSDTRLVPVNIIGEHPARRSFEASVLEMDRDELNRYWISSHFHGLSPPATQASPEAVKRFIASVEGAVGYLPLELVDDSLKVLYEY